MPQESSANVLDSLSKEEGGIPSGEGEIPRNKPPEEIEAENIRKAEEIKTLREEMQSLKDDYARLKELNSKPKKTASEIQEEATLEQQMESIMSNPEAKPWLTLIEKMTTEKSQKIAEELFEKRSRDTDEERARSIAISLAEKENIDPKEFGDALAEILDDNGSARWIDCNPSERVARAYREWQRQNQRNPNPANRGQDSQGLPIQSSGRSKAPAETFTDRLNNSKKADNFSALLRDIAKSQESSVK